MIQCVCRWLVNLIITSIIRLTNYKTKQKSPSLTRCVVNRNHRQPFHINHGISWNTIWCDHCPRYRGLFFMSIHMHNCSCVHLCVASVVRTSGTYISTYRTSLSVYNIFHMMSMLTASHVASMVDTTDNIMCCHDG